MSGRHKFETLTGKIPAKRRKRIDLEKKRLRREMALHELRSARNLTQVKLADILNVEQPAIARIERRRDMLVSKLKGLVKGMGGELRLVAHFPDGDVVITNFASGIAAKSLTGG